jgi:hypothetical protein
MLIDKVNDKFGEDVSKLVMTTGTKNNIEVIEVDFDNIPPEKLLDLRRLGGGLITLVPNIFVDAEDDERGIIIPLEIKRTLTESEIEACIKSGRYQIEAITSSEYDTLSVMLQGDAWAVAAGVHGDVLKSALSKIKAAVAAKTTGDNWWSTYDDRQPVDQFFSWMDIRIALL